MSKNVYAPWREEYLLAPKQKRETGCLFCRVLREKRDKQNLVLCRGKLTFIMMNRYPYTSGHLMVAPIKHVGSIEKLDETTWFEMTCEARRAVAALKKAFHPHGINLGMNLGRPSGAGVPGHLHIHLVPRWSGDTSFMPVIGGVRVVSVSLDTTYRTLKPLF
jgi:ATP adenylyltransferase